MAQAGRDQNNVPTLLGVSNVDGSTPVAVYADPTTHRLLVDLPTGSGTVTSVSVVSANGFAGTVATATTTPAITLSTTVTGILSGNGTAISAATTTGSGSVVLATSPTLVTPTLGVASATSINKLTLTAPATGATLTLADGTTVTGPATTDTLVGKATTDVLTNKTYDTAGAGNIFKINGTQITAVTGTGSAVLAASPTFTGTVTVPTPSNATDASTKGYVDSVAQGLSVKPSAVVATTTGLPSYTYNNGSSGVGATITAVATGTLTIDGYTVALNDYILVKNETSTNAPYNGLYKCTIAGAVGVAFVLTRAVEMDDSSEFVGSFMFVERGTVNVSSGWVCTNTSAPTVGTTNISFTQFSGAGEIIAGNGLSKSANTLSIDTTITADLSSTQTITGAKTFNDGDLKLAGATSGASTLKAAAVASTYTVTLPAATDTLVGLATTDTLTNKTLTTPVINQINASTNTSVKVNAGSYTPTQTYTPSAAGTATLNLSLGNVHFITMPAGNITIALSNPTVGQTFLIRILQDAIGSRTVTWFTTIKWAGGTAPTLTTTASKADMLGFVCTGSGTYDGFVVGQNI